MAKIKL